MKYVMLLCLLFISQVAHAKSTIMECMVTGGTTIIMSSKSTKVEKYKRRRLPPPPIVSFLFTKKGVMAFGNGGSAKLKYITGSHKSNTFIEITSTQNVVQWTFHRNGYLAQHKSYMLGNTAYIFTTSYVCKMKTRDE